MTPEISLSLTVLAGVIVFVFNLILLVYFFSAVASVEKTAKYTKHIAQILEIHCKIDQATRLKPKD